MLTLIHLGDFHATADARNVDRFRVLDQIISDRRKPAVGGWPEQLGAWLWPGDLNGPIGRALTVENRNALADRLLLMADLAPVLIVPGNHDQKDDLEIFGKLKATFPIHVVTTPCTQRICLATGAYATVFFLPYPTRVDESLEGAFDAAALALKRARAEGDLTFMIGHVNVRGAVMSTGQPAIGHEVEITTEQLDRLGSMPKLLNHIHKPQEIGGAHYAGSLCRLSFGEIEEKRYLVVECDHAMNCGHLMWRYRVRSVPIQIPPMYHVSGAINRSAFLWNVTDGPDGAVLGPPESWIGTEVRVRYTYQQSELSVLGDHQARVRAEFAGANRIVLEPVMSPDRAVRAPAVALAKTLAAKVEAWAEVAGVTASERVLAKLQRLEQTDPVQLVNAVQEEVRQMETEDEEVMV